MNTSDTSGTTEEEQARKIKKGEKGKRGGVKNNKRALLRFLEKRGLLLRTLRLYRNTHTHAHTQEYMPFIIVRVYIPILYRPRTARYRMKSPHDTSIIYLKKPKQDNEWTTHENTDDRRPYIIYR